MSEQTANLCTTDAAESLRAVVAERDREIERLKEGQSILILARDEQKRLANEYRDLWSRAAVKAQPARVVLPEPLKRGDEGGSGEYGAAMIRGYNACLREVARLNQAPVSAGEPCECGGSPHTTECLYEHFLSYSQMTDHPLLRYAYFHGAHAECEKPSAGGVDERAAFEAWARKHNSSLSEDEIDQPEDINLDKQAGVYIWANAESAWMAWQARAALSAPSHGEQVRHMVPAGWKLVPVEPTREMISAASGAITTPDDLPPAGAGRWSMSDIAFRSRYRAALAAAPSPASQKEQK